MAKIISTSEIKGESILNDVPILDETTPLTDDVKMYLNVERTFRQIPLSRLINWIKSKIEILINGENISPNNITATGTISSDGDINIPSGAKYRIGGSVLSYADVGAVPRARRINNKSLANDVTLKASDVGAVPTSRTVNGKALTGNISLNAGDVGAVPTSRAVNGKTLSGDISLNAGDVGAVPRSIVCYANSRIDTFDSSGNVTIPLSSFGMTTGQKPVGILLDHQNGSVQDTAGKRKIILQYDYDNSTNSQIVIRAHHEDGTPASGNIRYFAMVFQGSWLNP